MQILNQAKTILNIPIQDEKAAREELFGPMAPLEPEEYDIIYTTTGLDVDGRSEIIKNYAPHIEDSVRDYIRIVRHIPGFDKLPNSDKTHIVRRKYCRFNSIKDSRTQSRTCCS